MVLAVRGVRVGTQRSGWLDCARASGPSSTLTGLLPVPQVNKVAGNFHFAPGRSYQQGSMHVHDIAVFGDAVMDFSHHINSLSFGKAYPGMKNPLDKVKASHAMQAGKPSGMYQYFLKVRVGRRWRRGSFEGVAGAAPPPLLPSPRHAQAAACF